MDACVCFAPPNSSSGCFYKSILNAITEMILVKDGNDKLVYINAPLASYIGHDKEVSGLDIAEFVPANGKERGSLVLLDKLGSKHFFYITTSSNISCANYSVHVLKQPLDQYELIAQYFDSIPYKMGITTLHGTDEDEITPILANEETRKALHYQPLHVQDWTEQSRKEIIIALKESRRLGYVLLSVSLCNVAPLLCLVL